MHIPVTACINLTEWQKILQESCYSSLVNYTAKQAKKLRQAYQKERLKQSLTINLIKRHVNIGKAFQQLHWHEESMKVSYF